MSQAFSTANAFHKIAKQNNSGYLQISANSLQWNIYFVEGRIKYAQQSLQSPQTLTSYLLSLDLSALIKTVTSIRLPVKNNPLSLLLIIEKLNNQNLINSQKKATLIQELSKDALESLFWLESQIWLSKEQVKWTNNNPLLSDKSPILINQDLGNMDLMLQLYEHKLREWQKLQPWIKSPHQCPFCPDLTRLQKSVPEGNISSKVLEQLVISMRGNTIRTLSHKLKQDDLKIAQLLLPYIKQQVISLNPPLYPFNQLPSIPPPHISTTTEKIKPAQVNSSNTTSTTIVEKEIPYSPPSKFNIICIDDSQVMLDTIEEYLGDKKYRIITVTNPMQSLPSLFANKPHLILLDLSMPNINGNRLCPILRRSEAFKNTPIIIVSGDTLNLNQEKITAIGANDFLPKPFTKEELLAMVNKYLTQKTQ